MGPGPDRSYQSIWSGGGPAHQLRLALVWCNLPMIMGYLCLIPLWVSTDGVEFRLQTQCFSLFSTS